MLNTYIYIYNIYSFIYIYIYLKQNRTNLSNCFPKQMNSFTLLSAIYQSYFWLIYNLTKIRCYQSFKFHQSSGCEVVWIIVVWISLMIINVKHLSVCVLTSHSDILRRVCSSHSHVLCFCFFTLMIINVEHLFVYLLVTQISSFEKGVFQSQPCLLVFFYQLFNAVFQRTDTSNFNEVKSIRFFFYN